MALCNPKIPKADILNLKTTPGVETTKSFKRIPRGRLEIIPDLTDVPGSRFESVWDAVLPTLLGRILAIRYSGALVVVVCPNMGDGRYGQHTVPVVGVSQAADRSYLDRQLGYVEAMVAGALGARKTEKPEIVIMFISKFDQFSKAPPEDTSASTIRAEVVRLFKDHIDSVTSAAKRAKIPFQLVVGSAAEKWNTELVLDIIVQTLYEA